MVDYFNTLAGAHYLILRKDTKRKETDDDDWDQSDVLLVVAKKSTSWSVWLTRQLSSTSDETTVATYVFSVLLLNESDNATLWIPIVPLKTGPTGKALTSVSKNVSHSS